MIKILDEDKAAFIRLALENKIYLEGPVLKMIDTEDDQAFKIYLAEAIENDQSNRKKRLAITKQIQAQNAELQKKAEENDSLMDELKDAVQKAEDAKKAAINDLDLVQKKTQFELIGNIVNVALYTIMGVGIITTGLYAAALFWGNTQDTTLLGNTWSNLFGILLTNSFSIIGTIMGVKYASEKGEGK
jgi:hypothetical protein